MLAVVLTGLFAFQFLGLCLKAVANFERFHFLVDVVVLLGRRHRRSAFNDVLELLLRLVERLQLRVINSAREVHLLLHLLLVRIVYWLLVIHLLGNLRLHVSGNRRRRAI